MFFYVGQRRVKLPRCLFRAVAGPRVCYLELWESVYDNLIVFVIFFLVYSAEEGGGRI